MEKIKHVQEYNALESAFGEFIESVKRIVASCDEDVFGLKPVAGNTFSGFGKSIRMEWAFVIHQDEGYGKLMVSMAGEDMPFYVAYFNRKGMFKKEIAQKSYNFFPTSIPSIEDMLFEIVAAMLNQDCFKP